MPENSRLIYECALGGAMCLIERFEQAGVEMEKEFRDEVIETFRASIEAYIVERNRMLQRLFPLGEN